MTQSQKILCTVLVLLILAFTGTGTASPAFEVLSGNVEMNENNITGIGHLSVNEAITDGNISDSITISSAGSVATDAVSDGAGSGLDADLLDGKNTSELNWTELGVAKNDVNKTEVGLGNLKNLNQSSLDGSGIVWEQSTEDYVLNPDDSTLELNGNQIRIKKKGVTSTEIDSNTINASNIEKGAVTESGQELTAGAVNTTAIKNGDISNEDLANSSLTVAAGSGLSNGGSVSLGDSTTLDLNPDDSTVGVSGDQLKVLNKGISSNKIADGTINKSDIGQGAVTESGQELAASSVNSTAIKDGEVDTSDIASNAVTDSEVKDTITISGGSVDSTDLTDSGTVSYNWTDVEVADNLTLNSTAKVDPAAVESGLTDSQVDDDLTISSSGQITLASSSNPSTDGRIEWDDTNDRIDVGDGSGTTTFYSGPHSTNTNIDINDSTSNTVASNITDLRIVSSNDASVSVSSLSGGAELDIDTDVVKEDVSLGNLQNINQSDLGGTALVWDQNNQDLDVSGVSSSELITGAVNSEEITNGAVNGTHINDNGASNGDPLEYDGSKWAPGTDDNTQLDSESASSDVDINSNNLDKVSGLYSDDSSTSFFTGSCSDNQHITGIDGTGSISCGDDSGNLTDITTGTHLSGDTNEGSVSLSVEDDFVLNSGDKISGSLKVDNDANTDAVYNESGIDRISSSSETFNIENSGAGTLELQEDGNAVVTENDFSAASDLNSNGDLVSGSITESGQELSAGAVNSSAIKDSSVDTSDLASNAVTDSEVKNSITIGTSGQITLPSSSSPTTEGRIEWDGTNDRMDVGNSGGTSTFYSGPHTSDSTADAETSGGTTEVSQASAFRFIASSDASVSVDNPTDDVARVDYDVLDTDTNASTKCSSDEVLEGGGSCVTNYESGDDGDSDSTNERQGISATGDTIKIYQNTTENTEVDSASITDDNTQLDDDQPTSNVDMGTQNVTNTNSVQMNKGASITDGTSCTSSEEGKIVYNGTHHLGCQNGDSWKAFY